MVWQFLARSGVPLVVGGLRGLFSRAAKNPVTVGVGSDLLLNDGKLTKKIEGAVVEKATGVDPVDWKTASGLLITTLAIAGLSRQLLGDNIIGTIASLAFGIVSAFLFKDQIKKAAMGFEKLISPESSSEERSYGGQVRGTNSMSSLVPEKPTGP